ncbi:MAG: TonB-dependent receptor, partial [Duncaniella sp.]|nr:TonB-dependent receptor [Duncaniella sp.]
MAAFCLGGSAETVAQVVADTLTHRLEEVVVTARRPTEDIIPAQILSGEELHRLNSNSVADALRFFSGVQVK